MSAASLATPAFRSSVTDVTLRARTGVAQLVSDVDNKPSSFTLGFAVLAAALALAAYVAFGD